MKAFLNRFNRGLSSKDKDKDKEKDRDNSSILTKDRSDNSSTNSHSPPTREKRELVQLPPLPEWPPPHVQSENRLSIEPLTRYPTDASSRHAPSPSSIQIQRSNSAGTVNTSTGTPTSTSSHKPLPDICARPLPPIEEPCDDDSGVGLTVTPTPPHDPDPAARRKANGSATTSGTSTDVQKKVAFLSPPPTPSALSIQLPDSSVPSPSPITQTPSGAPLKTSVSRFQATHGKDSRGSISTAASSSRTDLATKSTTTTSTTTTASTTSGTSTTVVPSTHTAKATSTRTAVSPYPGSMRSTTPYSQMSNASSRILAVTSWSEGAEEDLVSNLGPRERTRQEVLWEIVASEERYVNDLTKMKETFIEPLLHPFAIPPPTSPTPTTYTEYDEYRVDSPQESIDVLPIAARFMSPIGFRADGPSKPIDGRSLATTTPNIDDESDEDAEDTLGEGLQSNRANPTHNHPRSPYHGGGTGGKGTTKIRDPVPFPSHSHASLPAPQRKLAAASSHSLGDKERERERKDSAKTTPTPGTRVLRKFKRSTTQANSLLQGAVPPHLLPEDLRICLEVIESGVLDGHVKLSEGLQKRYEEQYPLVRSLADVFVSSSHIFQGYATYVLHLERALEQVDNALSTASAAKKPKNQDAAEWLKVCKSLQRLEEFAADKGETGLAITLSKPFQRLLKYPLLFQNLLFHTDPSTFEYESTLQMVAEVETIVRSIEDEKIQKEDRDKTRDVFARIEGLDKVKQLAVPKPSRLLLEERQILGPMNGSGSPRGPGSSPPPVVNAKGVKGKSSFRRLSDVLGAGSGLGSKKDLWLVVFNDVVLRCQRTGTTSLPLVSGTNSRATSLPEMQGKSKYSSTGRRNSHTKPRNLYKFLKIETWAIGDVVQPNEGVVSMVDVVRSKAEARSAAQPRILPLPDEDEDGEGESDDSDKKSKMSFSYWGADKITLQKPVLKPKQHSVGSTRRVSPGGTSSYSRESSANAKFGTRQGSGDRGSHSNRPASRRTQATPSTRTRVNPSEDSHSIKATVTRPAWDVSTRGLAPGMKRTRQTSQTSAATRGITAPSKPQVSPVASEDSGVVLYRQMVAQDPSLVH
ncbi:Dbl homology domain-containing protein [Rhizopogon vinicolor AM-OR11-026]|uniref:Dbl homology domain-containing protein n=1 Tax=Rhizopogon vinicolor AM-OR11-026 TaxID=1314800 RepID=A0A1B7NF88_9AGAM|nr:Dbl homology domain-containing protein [Rhizopogon vinicolor AM-OR11-026]